ncbi:unnamed protein product [Diabrotica balteata]|uniref:Uncharacterized protein n=1 Tax=Diabrotica balteata TaxID=107213 RepID=A0A9N9X7H6_DIABA|nr:unnamed protein product [Diabrotica balteata]
MPGIICAVSTCKEYHKSLKDQGLKLHPFPKDPTLRERWYTFCKRRGRWNPSKSRICSHHFKNEDFVKGTCKGKLKRTAIPTIRCPSISQHTSDILRKVNNEYIHNSFKKNTTVKDQEIETNLSLLSKLRRNNSNIEIEFEQNTPEHRSYKPRSVKSIVLKDLSVPVIKVDALEEECNRLSQENKNIKEKLKKLQEQAASLPSLTDTTGTNIQPKYIIDLRDIRDLCRTCLLKSKHLTPINDKITLPNAEATEILISKALESILSTPLAVSDNVPNQICETCKNQIIFIATIRYAFEKANSILQLYSTGNLEKQAINKQNTIERDNTEINILPQCKVEEEDIFEEYINDVQSPEEIDCELEDGVNEDLVSDDPLESDKSLMYVSKVEPLLLQTDISIEDPPSRPKSPRYSKTRKFKSRISHTCPICYTVLPLDDFISHITGHKALQKYLRGPKNIRKTLYQASPRADTGLLGSEGEILHICYICQKQLKAAEYVIHMNQHFATDHFNCDKCGRVFKRKKFLLSHMVVHNDDPPYKCATCGKGFVIEINYKCHLLTHKDDELPYTCPECDRKFSNPTHLKRHMTIHTENVNYSDKYKYKRCTYCHQSVNTLKSLNSHVCKNPGFYRCKYCQKVFETSTARIIHISSLHNSTKNTPAFCKKCNVTVMDINTHKSSKHPRIKHLCTVCGSYVWNIYAHMHRHKGSRNKGKGSLTYHCPVCRKQFYHRNVLNKHVLIHSSEKPFMCSFCARTFNNQYNLQVHERVHVGERSHVCTFCDKAFLEKSYLNKHMKTHKKGSCQNNFYSPGPDILQDDGE